MITWWVVSKEQRSFLSMVRSNRPFKTSLTLKLVISGQTLFDTRPTVLASRIKKFWTEKGRDSRTHNKACVARDAGGVSDNLFEMDEHSEKTRLSVLRAFSTEFATRSNRFS